MELMRVKPDDYVVVNVWTSEDNKAIPGHNVGHISVGMKGINMSLFPGPRQETTSSEDLTKIQLRIRRLKNYFEVRSPQFHYEYEDDCIAEAFSEGYYREIEDIESLEENEIGIAVSEDGIRILKTDKAIDNDEILLAVTPIPANVRLALYGLDKGKIKSQFEQFEKKEVVGWRMIGSNVLSRNLKSETEENCASLALRLLQAGGMYADLSKCLSSQTSSVVKPETILKQVVAAKEKELKKAAFKKTPAWDKANKFTDVEQVKKAYKLVGKNANAEGKLKILSKFIKF